MRNYLLCAAFLATLAFTRVEAKESLHLPQSTKTCARDSPNVNSCILKAIKEFHPYMLKGVPELDLPPLDPLYLEETLLEYHIGYVYAKIGIRDYKVYGFKNMQFLEVRSDFDDLDNFKLEVDVWFPFVKAYGRYKHQGKFFKSEFGGKGTFNITMTDVKATWSYTGSKEVVDGVTYMKMKQLDMEPVVGDMKIYASNLFDGNEALSETALILFNQYWKLAYQELLPYAKKDWDKIMTEIANRVFRRVPFDEIFPKSS